MAAKLIPFPSPKAQWLLNSMITKSKSKSKGSGFKVAESKKTEPKGKLIHFPSPKACEWKLHYAKYARGGTLHYECLVFNYDKGLTAFEAWQISNFPNNPPFHEVTFEQLCSYPCPNATRQKSNQNARILLRHEKVDP